MPRLFFIAAAVFLSGPAAADGVLDKIKKGAENTASAIGQGADAVGTTIEKGVNAVDDTHCGRRHRNC